VLKVRDSRSVVTGLYILDPRRVQTLIAPGGEVFYQLSQDNLADVAEQVTVPAWEIIHDKVNAIFHPLVGLSPMFGCGGAATQGLEMQRASTRFFRKGATPSGIITIPGSVDPARAIKIKESWASGFTGDNAGAVAILADGARFEPMTMKSTDSEQVNQLKLTNELICSCYHVPAYMVGVGSQPTYNNIAMLSQFYFAQCLQARIESIEELMTLGLGLDQAGYTLQFDLRALLRMDVDARYKANTDAIAGGWLTPNEARRNENLAPVPGGDSCYMQQQDFSLAALAKRDAKADPFDTSGASATTPPDDDEEPVQRSAVPMLRLVSKQLSIVRNERDTGRLLLGRDAA
jgi:HK97 family phage portal protein